jgi:glycosyltransferase involved in cell wall biosynthesis
MSKPKIWVFNQFAGTPESGWGERHFYFAQYWLEAGHEVIIFSGSFNHVFKKNVTVEAGNYKEEIYKGVKFVWVKNPVYNPQSIKRFISMLIYTLRLFGLVKKYGIPQNIIVSSMPIFPILPALWYKSKYKANVIFEIRDIWPLTLIYLGGVSKWHPLVLFIGWFEKIAYKYSNKVVSLLPNARTHIEDVAGKTVDFHYIPNGIDPVLVGNEPIPNELKSKIPQEKFIVGYAGTIGLANALEHLIEAALTFEDSDDVFFLIVGDGYLKKELMLKCQGRNHILFYPKIQKSQVQDLLKYFDVAFVGRAGSELFSHGVSANKYFDYMLAGKPILDSNNRIKDPVELSGCGIIVEPDNMISVRQGILYLRQKSELELSAVGEKGKIFVNQHHQIKNLSKQYIELLK